MLTKIYDVVIKAGVVFVCGVALWSLPSSVRGAEHDVEIWWPTEGVRLSGTQPLKGLQKGYAVDDYSMTWQVDGGESVQMETSHDGYAHKEAIIDVSGWNWKGAGPYRLTFKTKARSGEVLAETSKNIYVDSASKKPVTVVPPVAVEIAGNVNVWWPRDDSHVSGSLPFKAVLEEKNIQEYSMTWQVDSGSENALADNYTDSPHKESQVDVSGWNWKGAGPYVLTFRARSKATGAVIGKSSRSIYIDRNTVSTTKVDVPVAVYPIMASNPLSGKKLFVEKNSPAAVQATQWSESRPADAALMRKIAENPTAIWLGSWLNDSATAEKVKNTVAAADGASALPVFVLYNLPFRDCGGYSAGGMNSSAAYEEWITTIVQALGGKESVILLEPDALAQIDCLTVSGKDERLRLLKNAVDMLKSTTAARVYVDAGHAGWIPATEMSERLKKAGIERADGFSLNVSNFDSTPISTSYGKEISSRLSNKHFVIDTSRNGRGANGEWCNPSGRALGQRPTTSTGEALIDAYLWIKTPGESDGNCNGGPSAGSWWSDYALGLAARAGW